MSNRIEAESIREQAVRSVISRLEAEQKKLRLSVEKRTYEMQQATRKQTQEKREIAELGAIIKQLNA
tara:strand:- start:364 stop:564 length:201 start_codon:yes stop_codon:yes gene_type:complete